MAQIGKEKREIEIDPLEIPAPEPVEEPAKVPA